MYSYVIYGYKYNLEFVLLSTVICTHVRVTVIEKKKQAKLYITISFFLECIWKMYHFLFMAHIEYPHYDIHSVVFLCIRDIRYISSVTTIPYKYFSLAIRISEQLKKESEKRERKKNVTASHTIFWFFITFQPISFSFKLFYLIIPRRRIFDEHVDI